MNNGAHVATTPDGVAIGYALTGAGPWLTLLHGFSQDRRIWNDLIQELAGQFRMLSVDFHGHGKSGNSPTGYGPHEYGLDVLTVLDALGVHATHVLGTHTGAAVGLWLASRVPERIASLTLEGAVIPGLPDPEVDAWHELARATYATAGAQAAVGQWIEESPFFRNLARADDMAKIVSEFVAHPWSDIPPGRAVRLLDADLERIRQPVALFNGEHDLPSFLERAGHLDQVLPKATRYVVPGASTFPAWENPVAVATIVNRLTEGD